MLTTHVGGRAGLVLQLFQLNFMNTEIQENCKEREKPSYR